MDLVGYPSKNFLKNLQKKPEVVEYLDRLPNKPERVNFYENFKTQIIAEPEIYNQGLLFF